MRELDFVQNLDALPRAQAADHEQISPREGAGLCSDAQPCAEADLILSSALHVCRLRAGGHV